MRDDATKTQSSKTIAGRVSTDLLQAELQRDLAKADRVVGTREDLSFSGFKRPCIHCGADTYTSRTYPRRLEIVCEVCFLAEYEVEDAPGSEGPDP